MRSMFHRHLSVCPIPRTGAATVAILALLMGCAGSGEPHTNHTAHPTPESQDGDAGVEYGPEIAEAVEQIREATAHFHDLEAAVAAGYSRDGGTCLAHPSEGAMGYHHMNHALMDDVLELERPEILTFERTADGEYVMTGVEYIVPKSAWSRSEPPSILGQDLRSAPEMDIWYLHVWVWRDNPNGLFADWNPNVECRR